MDNKQNDILDIDPNDSSKVRRRKLLPWWVKVFTWIFLLMGTFVPFGFLLGLLEFSFTIQLYGLSSYTPVSAIGMGLMIIFILKWFVAFGLWTERDWVINIGIVDAALGIIICLGVMGSGLLSKNSTFNFRFELLLLIPYLLWLLKIKPEWDQKQSK